MSNPEFLNRLSEENLALYLRFAQDVFLPGKVRADLKRRLAQKRGVQEPAPAAA